MIPPGLLLLRLRGFPLWLPLFLLWPLGLLLLPFVLLGALAAGKPLRLVWACYRLACALRGLSVQVEQPGQRIRIQFL